MKNIQTITIAHLSNVSGGGIQHQLWNLNRNLGTFIANGGPANNPSNSFANMLPYIVMAKMMA